MRGQPSRRGFNCCPELLEPFTEGDMTGTPPPSSLVSHAHIWSTTRSSAHGLRVASCLLIKVVKCQIATGAISAVPIAVLMLFPGVIKHVSRGCSWPFSRSQCSRDTDCNWGRHHTTEPRTWQSGGWRTLGVGDWDWGVGTPTSKPRRPVGPGFRSFQSRTGLGEGLA